MKIVTYKERNFYIDKKNKLNFFPSDNKVLSETFLISAVLNFCPNRIYIANQPRHELIIWCEENCKNTWFYFFYPHISSYKFYTDDLKMELKKSFYFADADEALVFKLACS